MPKPKPTPTPKAPKLSVELIVRNYRERYETIAVRLHQWEQEKAAFLVDVGADCLTLVRAALEPFAEHELTERKAARADLVKQIEAQLPDVEGIGAPQVNRWIRWAGVGEVLTPDAADCAADGNGVLLSWPCGLKQAHLMVLEKFVEQHEPTGTFRIKEPWKNRLDEVRACVKVTIESAATAAELETALDEEAEFPPAKPAEQKAEPCPTPAPSITASTAPLPTPPKPVPATTKSASPNSAGKSPAPTPASTGSNRSSAPSPTSSNTSVPSVPSAATSSSPRDLADQAFKLLQQPEILAGVFRREWSPDLVLAIVDNLIRANGEKSSNLLALAKAYHRAKPVVLCWFEEYIQDGKFKLRKKEQPEPPTLEQLAPSASLATA